MHTIVPTDSAWAQWWQEILDDEKAKSGCQKREAV
jgi:hypothetical protein